MTGSMPTRDGDVVITQQEASAIFSVWHVLEDGQQEPGSIATQSTVVGRQAARQLAEILASSSRGAIFLLEHEPGTWTRLSG